MAGDDCLKTVAQAIGSHIGRPGDCLARYGGDEFAVMLSNTDAAGATAVLENALQSVRRLAIPHYFAKMGRGVVDHQHRLRHDHSQ